MSRAAVACVVACAAALFHASSHAALPSWAGGGWEQLGTCSGTATVQFGNPFYNSEEFFGPVETITLWTESDGETYSNRSVQYGYVFPEFSCVPWGGPGVTELWFRPMYGKADVQCEGGGAPPGESETAADLLQLWGIGTLALAALWASRTFILRLVTPQ